MAETDLYEQVRKNNPHLNRTTLVGRIRSVSADPDREEIILGFEPLHPPEPPFKINAVIPCSKAHIASETHWYAKLWKKGRVITIEGEFFVMEGVLSMSQPDVGLTVR